MCVLPCCKGRAKSFFVGYSHILQTVFIGVIMTVFDYTVKKVGGDTVALSQYTGSVLLIVNTASA